MVKSVSYHVLDMASLAGLGSMTLKYNLILSNSLIILLIIANTITLIFSNVLNYSQLLWQKLIYHNSITSVFIFKNLESNYIYE